jgi:hypothetical protein
MNIPEDAIFRINLAWVNNIEELTKILKKHSSHQIFLDLPINRTKPPDNSYLIDDLIPIINNNENIEYWVDYSGLLSLLRNDDLAELSDVEISINIKDIIKVEKGVYTEDCKECEKGKKNPY